MGRIPKLVKEKALAEYHLSSSSTENDDLSLSNPSSSPSRNSTYLTQTDFDLQLIDEQLSLDDFGTSSAISPLCAGYVLTDNFTINEAKNDQNTDLFTLNRSITPNCTMNYEGQFSKNVIEHIEQLVTKISRPITHIELAYGESAFVRYLRWKMFDLYNTVNGGARQLIERMINMIKLDVNLNIYFIYFNKIYSICFRLKIFPVLIHLFRIY